MEDVSPLRIPFSRAMNGFSERKVRDALQISGKALPATVVSKTGSIVLVNFEVQSPFTLPRVRVPVAGSEYVRLPIQPGCRGVVFPADAELGAVTGLGSGTASLDQPANLAALVFFPLGNANFSSVDPNTLVLYGESGVLIRDKTAASQISVTSTSITLSAGGHTIVIDSSGVIIDGKTFLLHEHSGVQSGGSNSGGVV